jgi:hypothetical protein
MRESLGPDERVRGADARLGYAWPCVNSTLAVMENQIPASVDSNEPVQRRYWLHPSVRSSAVLFGTTSLYCIGIEEAFAELWNNHASVQPVSFDFSESSTQ